MKPLIDNLHRALSIATKNSIDQSIQRLSLIVPVMTDNDFVNILMTLSSDSVVICTERELRGLENMLKRYQPVGAPKLIPLDPDDFIRRKVPDSIRGVGPSHLYSSPNWLNMYMDLTINNALNDINKFERYVRGELL